MPVRVDAPADLGAASAERVARRLRLQNLGSREEGRSGVWELDCASASGLVRRGKNELSEPRDFSGVGSGGKFVVSRAGEAYYARVRGPNRKFRITAKFVVEGQERSTMREKLSQIGNPG
jgi:hypothetical protein